jgi:uncharacterized protein YciI
MATLSDFDCSPKAVAIYRPGPNWSQFRGRLPEHLDFVKARLDDGTMTFGAPMTDQAGQPTGGLFIYNDANIGSIEKLVRGDPFVWSGVVFWSVSLWGMCRSKVLR